MTSGDQNPDADLEYVYTPLANANCIRLFEVLDQDADGNFVCKIEQCEISDNDCPRYTAFSYTWGDEHEAKFLSIDGRLLGITENCHYAISQAYCLPDQRLHTPYWMESICINQDDLAEKSLQVARMDVIYSNARYTLSCIGQHADDSEQLYTMIKVLGAQRNRDADWRPPSLEFRELAESHGVSEAGLAEAKRALFCRPYFSRLWILQELALSHETIVLCGGDQCSLETLLSLDLFFAARATPYYREYWNKGSVDSTCLLYTSPSPRDGLLSRMPSSA